MKFFPCQFDTADTAQCLHYCWLTQIQIQKWIFYSGHSSVCTVALLTHRYFKLVSSFTRLETWKSIVEGAALFSSRSILKKVLTANKYERPHIQSINWLWNQFQLEDWVYVFQMRIATIMDGIYNPQRILYGYCALLHGELVFCQAYLQVKRPLICLITQSRIIQIWSISVFHWHLNVKKNALWASFPPFKGISTNN